MQREARPEVSGVVLAAGPGRRLGLPIPKPLLPVQGKPMLAWVLDLVARLPLQERVLVVGARAQQILAALFAADFSSSARWELRLARHGQTWRVLYNPAWPEGLGASLRRAAEAVPMGMILFLGDMPYVPERAALAVLSRAGARPVAPCFQGQRGFPVYLPASMRPELLKLAGDVGARDLLGACELIPWDHPGVVQDVDQLTDLGGGRPCLPFPL